MYTTLSFFSHVFFLFASIQLICFQPYLDSENIKMRNMKYKKRKIKERKNLETCHSLKVHVNILATSTLK